MLCASAVFLLGAWPVGHRFASLVDVAARAFSLSLSISSWGLRTEWLHVIALSLTQDTLLLHPVQNTVKMSRMDTYQTSVDTFIIDERKISSTYVP